MNGGRLIGIGVAAIIILVIIVAAVSGGGGGSEYGEDRTGRLVECLQKGDGWIWNGGTGRCERQ